MNSDSKEKAWYKSKTLIGVIIIAITVVLRRFAGVELGQSEQAELGAILIGLGEVFGVALAWWGRVSAKQSIKPILK